MPLLMEKEEDAEVVTPVVSSEDGVHYLYVLHNGVYFVGITKQNANAAAIFAFLHKLINVRTGPAFTGTRTLFTWCSPAPCPRFDASFCDPGLC